LKFQSISIGLFKKFRPVGISKHQMHKILPKEIIEHSIDNFLGLPSHHALLKFIFHTFTINSLEKLKKEIENNFKSKEKLEFVSMINDILINKYSSPHPDQFLLFCKGSFSKFRLIHQHFKKVYCNELEVGDSFLKDLILNRFHRETLKDLIFHFFFSTWEYEVFSNHFVEIVEKTLHPVRFHEIVEQEFISIETSIMNESKVFQMLCDKKSFPFTSGTLLKRSEFILNHMKKNQIPWDLFHDHSELIFHDIFLWNFVPEFESFMLKTMSFKLKSKLIYLFFKNNKFNEYSQNNVASHVFHSMKEFFRMEDSIAMDNLERPEDIVQRFFFRQLKKEMCSKTELTSLDMEFIEKLTRFEKITLLKNSWNQFEISEQFDECELDLEDCSEIISDSSDNVSISMEMNDDQKMECFEELELYQVYETNKI
jgi:hypothetical protein